MKHKFFYNIALITLSCFLFAGCIKNEVVKLGDAGKTRVKIAEAPENPFFLDQFTGVKPISLFSIRRDAHTQAELNKPATVTIHLDPAEIAAYNTAHGTDFELLPDSLYTLGQGITSTGGGNYTVSFAAGEFSKDFQINLNGSKWDLAHKYAFPVTITDPGGYEIGSGMDKVISLISVKNMYDGKYLVTGTLTDLAVATIVAKSPTEAHLVTLSGNSVEYYNSGTAIGSFLFLFPIMNGAAESAYGGFLPIFTFDANHNVTSVVNAYGQPASNTRSAELDPTGENKYDPATKTMKVKFIMKQPSAMPTPPNIRVYFDLTFTYLGSR